MQQKQGVICQRCLIAGTSGNGQREVPLCQCAVILRHRIVPSADPLQFRDPRVPLYIQIPAEADDQQEYQQIPQRTQLTASLALFDHIIRIIAHKLFDDLLSDRLYS